MSEFFTMMTYDFMQKAFVVGLLVSLCAALLGVSLVLKRYSMIGDGLSHVGFGAMGIAAAVGIAPLKVAVPVVVACAFFLLRLSEKSRLRGDSAIALISSSSMAIGVVAVSLSSGMNTDLMNYMFGSILSVSDSDAVFSIVLSCIVIVSFVLLYPKIFAVTFDETFAESSGIRVGIFNSVIAVLTAITVVLGMRIMGTLLISSLIIFPSATAMTVCRKFRSTVVASALLSVVCFVLGMVLSAVLGIPTGACVVCVNAAVFVLFKFILKRR